MDAQVYTCEYDQLVANAIDSCLTSSGLDNDGIPYYPAPDSAPGSCSCNQGNVLLTTMKITAQLDALNGNRTNVEQAIPDYGDQAIYWASAKCCMDAYIQSSYVQTLHIFDH